MVACDKCEIFVKGGEGLRMRELGGKFFILL